MGDKPKLMTRVGHQVLPEGAEPCAWMRAGLLAYKLCNRGYDCESCPLDAALRGSVPGPAKQKTIQQERASGDFPEDRIYSSSHLWLMALDSGRIRIGWDAFAARLIGYVHGINAVHIDRELDQDEIGCEVEAFIGGVPLRLPVRGRILRFNLHLNHRPGLLLTDPYEGGWVLEIQPAQGRELDSEPGLRASDAMRQYTRMDMDHFRRQVGMYLLMSTQELGPTMADGGEPVQGASINEARDGCVLPDWLPQPEDTWPLKGPLWGPTGLSQMLGMRRYHGLVMSLLT